MYWLKSYSEKEVPPENIWEDAEGLDWWFKRIEEARSDGATVDGVDEDEDDPRMLDNELLREL